MSTPHSPTELKRLYKKRFAGTSEYSEKVWRVLVDKYFARRPSESVAVLDLGRGHCEFIKNVRSDKRLGMHLNP